MQDCSIVASRILQGQSHLEMSISRKSVVENVQDDNMIHMHDPEGLEYVNQQVGA